MHAAGAVLLAQPVKSADEVLWDTAIDIAWAGNGTSAPEVAATLAKLITARTANHPAIQAITEHLLFLTGAGPGVSADLITKLALHVYRQL